MNFFTRASNGWKIAENCFKILAKNKKLLIFPLLSGLSLAFILGSFITAIIGSHGSDINNLHSTSSPQVYFYLFLYYLINYFVVVFFNTALTYCIGLYFKGEEVSLKKGIAFSLTRFGMILLWAVFAATIGTILRIIQENAGFLGKLLGGGAAAIFSIATYFVIPVITYENIDPITAFKRSAQMMKAKWGETVGAGFSFGFIQFMVLVFVAIAAITFGTLFNIYIGIAVAVFAVLLMLCVTSAVRSIFASAVYYHITGSPDENFNEEFINKLFICN